MDSKEYAWRIEKKVVLNGWQKADVIAGTFDDACQRAAEILDEDDGVFQVRFTQLGHSIECGCYIPQWLEGE